MPFFVFNLREVIEYYTRRLKPPPVGYEKPFYNHPIAVLHLVDYYHYKPSQVMDMDSQDVIDSLDIIFNKTLNEQKYNEYLEKKIKKR